MFSGNGMFGEPSAFLTGPDTPISMGQISRKNPGLPGLFRRFEATNQPKEGGETYLVDLLEAISDVGY